MMNSRVLSLVKSLVLGLIVLQSLLLAYFMRPMQDDYFNLASVQASGLSGMLLDTWKFHGGNMVQFLIHGVLILPSTQAFAFWNLALFFILTEVLVFLTVRSILKWTLDSNSNVSQIWIPLLTVAGFEGLFVPGFLGTYGFSLAALAHLWPVMAFTYGLVSLKKFKGSWVVALILGLIAGNSNLGESAFACGAWILIAYAFYKIENFSLRAGIQQNSNFYFLGAGVFTGTICIAIAPGFRNRASDQVGLPNSGGDFVWRFSKSFASFTADAVTHPMVWVLFFLGMAVVNFKAQFITELVEFRVRILAVGSLLIWLALILGSTFAYPAWHQSMGLYVLLLPLAFLIGTLKPLQLKNGKVINLLLLSSLVMSGIFIRAGVLGVSRSLSWDRNLQVNICLLQMKSQPDLIGAEIRYPPFGLGVEDINTWTWMRDKYSSWVLAIPSRSSCLETN